MYNYEKENWAEEKILSFSERYGTGKFVKFILRDKEGKSLTQVKYYDGKMVSYPDIENRDDDGNTIYLLIEVKSRAWFYKYNEFLAIKEYSLRNYREVQKREGAEVRIVYLIGDENSYDLFWMNFDMLDKMETHREKWSDVNDTKSYVYNFFHSSQLRRDVVGLFEIKEKMK